MTDPIADMLTRIRNAQSSHITELTLPYSKIKHAIAGIMAEQGYLSKVSTVKNGAFESLQITLGKPGQMVAIKRVSKPGRRIYVKANEIPSVLGGRGLVVMSTSAGIMSGFAARKAGLGGEVICEVS